MKHTNSIWKIAELTVPVLLGFALGYLPLKMQIDANEKVKLDDGLNKLFDINLKYPYLEDSTFIGRWNKNEVLRQDSAYRYEVYCEYIFNYTQDVCDHFKYDKSAISEYIDLSDLIEQHSYWWNLPEQKNKNSYPAKMRKFLEGYFDK